MDGKTDITKNHKVQEDVNSYDSPRLEGSWHTGGGGEEEVVTKYFELTNLFCNKFPWHNLRSDTEQLFYSSYLYPAQ